MPDRLCVHCRASLQPDALVCNACHNYQMPRWLARLLASPLVSVLRFVMAGLLLWTVSTVYQRTDTALRERTDRALALSRSSMTIQTVGEQLIRPCLLTKSEDCARHFDDMFNQFAASAYTFKEEAKHIFYEVEPRKGETIKNAIDFLDDFYNPSDVHFDELLAMPLEIEILRAAPLLGAPVSAVDWCSVESRARMRALMLSVDVYRYCYQVVRRYAREFCRTRSLFAPKTLPVEASPAYHACASTEPLAEKVNRIAGAVSSLGQAHSAPWNYDVFCGSTPATSIQGSIIPPATGQLVVVVAPAWTRTRGASPASSARATATGGRAARRGG